MPSSSFNRFAGVCAILAGLVGFLYSIAFILLVVGSKAPDLGELLSALSLVLGGLLSTPAWVALYSRLREVDSAFALWAFVLGILGAMGAVVHGGYDLANAINAPTSVPAGLPNQVDPRGLLVFGVTGVALGSIAWLMKRSPHFPTGLASLAYLSAVLLLVLYVGRLIILTPTNPMILVPAVLTGFIVNPLWYVWLGIVLVRRKTV